MQEMLAKMQADMLQQQQQQQTSPAAEWKICYLQLIVETEMQISD